MYIYAYRYIHINTHIRMRMMNGWVTARKRHLFVRTRVLDGGFYSQPSGNFPFVSFFLTLKQIAACPAHMPKRSVSLQHAQLLAPRRLGQWSEIIAHTILHKWRKKIIPLFLFFCTYTHTHMCRQNKKNIQFAHVQTWRWWIKQSSLQILLFLPWSSDCPSICFRPLLKNE